MTHLVWEHVCWGAGGVGLEHLSIRSGEADGVIAWVEEDGRPYRLTYEVAWDPNWIFRHIEIDLTGEAASTLELARAPGGEWKRDGVAAPDLDGCDEVDLWPTPFTNSLPIRRLRLDPSSTATITVAHVIAPELTVTPRPQRYSNLGRGIYRFESLDDRFTADLVVDEAGFIVDYPGLFRRRAKVGAAATALGG